MESGNIVGGKYRLRHELGVGAMGSVWSATHELLDREVAIKFLLPSLEGSETASARFVAEAKAAARVKHRFVVDVFDFGVTEQGLYYMVQELLVGSSLADCMADGPAWPLAEVLRFTAQCLSGLEAVHQLGIVHRDLKPENIFVIRDPEGTHPKLLDFGISKASDPQASSKSLARSSSRSGRARRLTGVGTTIGTPAYMSPEQLCSASTMNGSADLYSVGVILYEWLSGHVPFGDTTNAAELYRLISARAARPLRSLRPDLSPELCALIDRALEPEPAQRFATAAEMRAEILRILPSQPAVSSVVQKAQGSVPSLGGGTQSLLSSAATPFQAEERVSIPGLERSRLRGLVLAGVGALAVGLGALALWPDARGEPARGRLPPPRSTEPEVRAPAPSVQERGEPALLEPLPQKAEPTPAAEVIELQPETAAPSAADAPIAAEKSEAGTQERPSNAEQTVRPAPARKLRLRHARREREATSARSASEPRAAAPTRPARVSEPAASENTKVVRTLDF